MKKLEKFQSGDFISLIPDSSLELLRRKGDSSFYKLDLNLHRKSPIRFDGAIKIRPWAPEHYSSLILLKVKLYCERRNVKVIASGLMNYLPALGMIADELYLESSPNSLSQTYNNLLCSCGTDIKPAIRFYCKWCSKSYDLNRCPIHDRKINRKRLYYCPTCDKEVLPNTLQAAASRQTSSPIIEFNDLPVKYIDIIYDYTIKEKWNSGHRDGNVDTLGYQLQEAADKEINDAEIIERYGLPETFILRSSWEKFHQLKDSLPKNNICCETKSYYIDNKTVRGLSLPLVGGDSTEYQKNLIKISGADHYMAFQILGSLYLNWFYICRSGSANILSMLPVKVLTLAEIRIDDKYHNMLRGLSINRFGEIGKQIPFLSKNHDFRDSFHRYQGTGFNSFLEDNSDTINEFLSAFIKKDPLLL